MKFTLGRLVWFMIIAAILASCPFAYSQNLQPLGSCPLPLSPIWSAVWVDGNYAYLTRRSSPIGPGCYFVIIDVSDSTNPTIIAIDESIDFLHDVCVNNNYAYLAYVDEDAFGGGLVIMDISDRTNPYRISFVNTGWWAHRLYKEKNMIYLANSTAGLSIIDVMNPFGPYLVGAYDDPVLFEAQGIYVRETIAYLVDWYGFSIIDVSNITYPLLLGQLMLPGNWYFIDVCVCGNYAFLLQMESPTQILIIDISDLENPRLSRTFYLPQERSGASRNLFFSAPYLFIAHDFLSVYDISDPLHPQLAAAFNDTTGNKRIKDIYYRNNMIYAAADSFLLIFQFEPLGIGNDNSRLPNSEGILSNYPNPFNARTTIEYALPSTGQINLEIYDIRGRKIAVLFSGFASAGNHKAVWDAGKNSSGIYFVRLEAGKETKTGKLLLLK